MKKRTTFILSFVLTFLIVGGGGFMATNAMLDRQREEGYFDRLLLYLEFEMRDRVRAASESPREVSVSNDFIYYTLTPEPIIIPEAEEQRPNAINFLLVGLDNRRLADAIIIGSLHRDTGDINFMSIPRDLRTPLTETRQEQLAEQSRWGVVPPVLKINEVRALGGRVEGLHFMKEEISDLLGVPIDYYVEIRLGAFRRVVDAIGGVDFFVPRDMFYEDPAQDLLINLRQGQQRLFGVEAEGLVRFRDAAGPGWNRDLMQLEFMRAVLDQTLSREGFLNNPLGLINIVLSEVSTNAGLSVVQYIPLIPTIREGNVSTFTLPGRGRIIDRLYFFVPDMDYAPDVIRQVFFLDS